jgi:acetyl/propionyl-CoA carboxylase alpha subunit
LTTWGALADRVIEAVPLPTLEPFTRRARSTLEAAVRAARSLGHTETGTEHLLLGLLQRR